MRTGSDNIFFSTKLLDISILSLQSPEGSKQDCDDLETVLERCIYFKTAEPSRCTEKIPSRIIIYL